VLSCDRNRGRDTVTERFGYDRDTVSGYLSDLASARFIEPHTVDTEQGGTVMEALPGDPLSLSLPR